MCVCECECVCGPCLAPESRVLGGCWLLAAGLPQSEGPFLVSAAGRNQVSIWCAVRCSWRDEMR